MTMTLMLGPKNARPLEIISPRWFSAVVSSAPPGDIWQCLETLVIVTTERGVLLASSELGPGCCQTSDDVKDSLHHKELSEHKHQEY